MDEAFGVMLLGVDGVSRHRSFKLWIYFGMISSRSIWLLGQGLLALRVGKLGFPRVLSVGGGSLGLSLLPRS